MERETEKGSAVMSVNHIPTLNISELLNDEMIY